MKAYVLGFLIILACHSFAQSQNEVRCKLFNAYPEFWLKTETDGSCSTSPQLWKKVEYQSKLQETPGISWYRLCASCPSDVLTFTIPSVFSNGACFALDGYVIEECWPIFFAPGYYSEPSYCGDVMFQVTQSQTVGSFNPATASNCVKNPSLTQKFDCVSGNIAIISTNHGECPTAAPSPSVAPTPCSPTIKLDGGTTDSCECNPDDPNCVSPVLIDISGNGFDLTDAAGGVDFDMRAEGSRLHVAWTKANSDDAWLVLDRDGDGTIDNGQEMFGNFTPQALPPTGQARNGFLALAEYDKPTNGGNSDGLITPSDTVFASLRLWRDLNHNGFSEASELFSLQAMRVEILDLSYKLSKSTDEHGNRFRYRAKVSDGRDAKIGRWAWDVFLVFTP
jgi:hypothetical protein